MDFKSSTPLKQLKHIVLFFNVLWTVMFIGAYIWGINAEKKSSISLAAKEAEASFNKDLVYRRWAAGHGGVYVPTTESTPPNPFLSYIPERDITTPSGKDLTLVNPAYMTRQVYELAADQYGVLGHITSLNPLRPENKPDEWEKLALDKFSKGIDEISSIELIDGKPYLRYMKRLITEKRCLKCHASQGYQEGDVRGGISTSVPLSAYYEINSQYRLKYALIILPIWLFGILLFNIGVRFLHRQLRAKEEVDKQLDIQRDILDKSQEIAHLGSWHLDIKKNILTWSDENYRVFGLSKDKFEHTYEAFLDKVHPDDREMVERTYTNAINNKLPYECVHRIVREDGEIRIVLEKSEDITDENGETIHSFGFTQDITELKLTERLYLAEKEKANKFLHLAGFMFVSLNTRGEITLINQKGCQILNVDENEAIGKNWFDHYLPKRVISEAKEVFNELMAGSVESVEYYENPILTSAGEERPIAFHNAMLTDENGNVEGILFSGEDITFRKHAEETFQTIVKSTVGRTGQDFFDNICTQICSVFNSECAIVGELVDTNTVKAIAMFLDGKPVKNFSYKLTCTPCENAATSGFCHYPKDIIQLFPDDKDLQDMNAVGYAGIPLRDHKGEVIGILSTISRRTMILPQGAEDLLSIIAARISAEIERLKEEREKVKLENRLQQAQKMEAIGTLAGGIAHDFNNILGIIIGYTDMAKEDAPSGTQFEEDLEKVSIAANRAKDLVKQILAFSRQSQVERLPIKIQPLVKEGLKMLRSSIPTTISITEDIDPKSKVILADPTQIHQILINLCTNAYQAMEESGGALSVFLKTAIIDPIQQKILDIAPGEYVELTVSDTGMGIGPDVIDKIFDPYFTTKEMGKGTGLGLAIIHGIIKDYGGTITVESKLGKGSTFHVYLPVIEEENFADTKITSDIPLGNERILFVDDEVILAEMGKSMLERLGYHVTVRQNSPEALLTFQNNPTEFDLVITDQTMPDMTGAELARRMIQARPDIPIILCTGYSNLIDESTAKAMGVKEFTLKPLTKEVIAKLIRKVLDGEKVDHV